MPLIVSQGCLVRLVWTLNGTPAAVNVLGIKRGTGVAVDQAFADAVGLFIKGAFTASGMDDKVSTAVALASVGVRDINTPSQPEILDTNAASPGTAVGSLLPPQVALCITLRTALAGKEYRGRFYQFGWTATSLTPTGSCVPADAEVCRAWINQIRTTLATNSLPLQVISRKLNVGNAVSSVVLRDPIFDTIRKRAVPGI